MEEKTELQKNEISGARRKELENFQRALDVECLNSRMDDGRLGRRMALNQREAEMEKEFQEKEERHANIILQKELYSDEEVMGSEERENTEQREKTERNAQYYKELQQQIVGRQQQRQYDYEDMLSERKMLQETSRTMADEDYRELQQKRADTENLHKEMVTSQAAREVWKDNQKAMIVNEERQIEQQRLSATDWDSVVIAERERKMQATDDVHQKMGAKNLFNEEARQEKENVIELLHEQEDLKKNVQHDIADMEKSVRVKREMMVALTDQMEGKKQDVLKQKQIDVEYRRQTDEQMSVDDDKEREEALKLKEKGRQYSEDLRRQIEDNARRRAKEHEIEGARAEQWDAFNNELTDEQISVEDEKEREEALKLKEKGRQYSEDLRRQIEDNARRRAKEHEIDEAWAQHVWYSGENW